MLVISSEGPEDGPPIEALLDRVFGPDRRSKTSYRYRDGVPPLAELCYVARAGDTLVGAIRYWPIQLGARPALLLGPLAIDPDRQGQGIGRALTRATLALAEGMGWRLVFLVGDAAYYARYGFGPAPANVVMPDERPGRLQHLTLAGATLPPEGGELLAQSVEIEQQRLAEGWDAFVGGHAVVHLADPGGHRPGHPSLAHELGQRPDQRADREHHGLAPGQPAQGLPLDPQPEQRAGIGRGEADRRLARVRVE